MVLCLNIKLEIPTNSHLKMNKLMAFLPMFINLRDKKQFNKDKKPQLKTDHLMIPKIKKA